MSVRAKFITTEINITPSYKTVDGKSVMVPFFQIKASPVMPSDECPENKQYWESSPSGQFVIGTTNKAAADQYEVGKSFYLDCSPA